MPDFGLTEALATALKAARGAPVMRPAEVKLAEAAARTAPVAAAPEVPAAAARAPSAQAPPMEAPPNSVQAPQLDPGTPPADVPAPQAADAAEAPAAALVPPEGAPAPMGAPADPAAAAALESPPETPQPAPAPGEVAPGNAAPPAPTPEPILTDVQQSAKRFVTANMGDFAGRLDMTHMPNTDVITSPDKWKAALLQVADDNQAAIEEARGPAGSNEQLTGLAQDLGVNEDTVRQRFDAEFGAETPENGVQRRAIITAARIVEQNEVGTALALSDKVIDGTATSEEIIEWQKHQQAILSWRTRLAATGAEAGRNLQALGIPVNGTLPQEVLDHIAGIIKQNNPDLQATAKAMKLASSPAGVANIIGGMANIPLWRRIGMAVSGLIQRIYINGILSGPQTWAKIFSGNNVNLALNNFDIYAAGVGRGIYGYAARTLGFATSEEGAAISDAVAHMHGAITGAADGLRVAGRVLKTGESLDGIMRGNEGASKNARSSILAALPELQDTWFGGIARSIDTIIGIPGRVINATDEFTKTMGYRGYVTMMSLKEIRARLTQGTLRPGDAEQVMQDMMTSPSPEMQQAAEDWAHRMTFQTPFTPGGVGEAFQAVLNKAPVLRFIFPFMRTATNIFKQSIVERTPFAVMSARLRAQIAGGGFEGDLAKSRIATGTAVGSMFAWMAIHDRVTGAPPKDPKERAEWQLDGRTPYSIRVTDPLSGKDTWLDYSWFEPMATVVGATADAVKLQSYMHAYDDGDSLVPHEQVMDNVASHIVASIIENTGNKTFMQGAAQFSEMYTDPQRGFSMWSRQMGASLVPFSGATKFLRNEQDPYLRQAHTLMEQIRNNLPTVPGVDGSKTLAARLDVFGQPRFTRTGNAILGPLSPLPGSDSKKDDLTDEIQSIMEQTRSVPITMPAQQIASLGAGKGLEGGKGMKLTPEEYNDFVRLARSEPIFDGGKLTFRQKLEARIASSTYQQATPAARAVMLETIQNLADKIGRERLYQENSDFRTRMLAWTADKNRLKYNK